MNDIMTRVMLGKPRELHVTSYFAAKRYNVDSMLQYENSYPYVIGLVLRATKNIINVPVKHRSREVGSSGYTMKKLLGAPEAVAVLERFFPKILKNPALQMTAAMTLRQVAGFAQSGLTADSLAEIDAQLRALPSSDG